MTARLPRGTWLEGGAVHLDDAHGWPTTIPAREAHRLLTEAKDDDDGLAFWGNCRRPFDRDTLQGAANLLDDFRCTNCHERPGHNDMGDGHRFCDPCSSAAQGSHYDDKTEF